MLKVLGGVFIAVCALAWGQVADAAGNLVLERTNQNKVAKLMVGELEVLVFEDIQGSMKSSVLRGPLTEEQLHDLLPDGSGASSVNVVLVRSPGRTVLIDAGYGKDFNRESLLQDLLKWYGIDPAEIDTVLLTHLHVDHVGGLLLNGQKAFPNATVYASQQAIDFWIKDTKGDNPAKMADRVYGGLKPCAFASEVAPGILSLEAIGHTPGHTAFIITSRKSAVTVIGDIIHAASVQFACPDEYVTYDIDAAAAVSTRKAILGLVARNRGHVLGMHIPFPGVGKVEGTPSSMTFTPLTYKAIDQNVEPGAGPE